MYEQEPIMYYPFRHDANFKESSLNSSASTLLDTGASGRPFTSFSGQSSTTPVFNHGGSLQSFNNVQGSYNLPSALSRNAGLGGTSNAIHQPAGGLPSGRFPSSNLPIGLSQLSQSSLHGHSSMTNRGALNVVGNHPLSSAMNGGGVSGPGSVALGNRGNLTGLGGSLAQMGASGPRVQPSVGSMAGGAGAGSLNRTLSSGGGLPSLSGSRVNMGPISNAGGLGGGPTSGRAMSPMLQQGVNSTYSPSSEIVAMLRSGVGPQVSMLPSFSSTGAGLQGQLPTANGQLGNLLNDGGQNDGAAFDMSEFPSLSNRHNAAAGLQGTFRKQGVAVNSLGQQNQEFSIQNEDFPALPGFKGGTSAEIGSELKERHNHENPLGVMQQQHFGGMGRSAAFPLNPSFVRQQQQQQHLVSGAPASLAAGSLTQGDSNLSHMHGTDNFPSSHGLSASYHSQMHTSSQGSQIALGSLRSPSPAVVGTGLSSYELLHQYEHHQQPTFRLGAHPPQQLSAMGQPSRGDISLRHMQEADRFGLLGLLGVIRMTDHDLTTLALGTDLTTLGLNLNSRENLYKTFASPWADGPVKGEPEFTLPQCYVQQAPRLQPGYFKKFPQESLFYIFYSMPNDEAQLYAAHELCSRGWFYHKMQQVWFTKASEPSVKTASYERGAYLFFDQSMWDTVRKENFVLHYDHVEQTPQLPQQQQQQQHQQHQQHQQQQQQHQQQT